MELCSSVLRLVHLLKGLGSLLGARKAAVRWSWSLTHSSSQNSSLTRAKEDFRSRGCGYGPEKCSLLPV